jgi:hypothetical protein
MGYVSTCCLPLFNMGMYTYLYAISLLLFIGSSSPPHRKRKESINPLRSRPRKHNLEYNEDTDTWVDQHVTCQCSQEMKAEKACVLKER